MKATLYALFTALLVVGCGESSQTFEGVDMTDTAPNTDAMESAVEWSKLQDRVGVTYLPNAEKPFSGYAKKTYENDQVEVLAQIKDGYVTRVKQWKKNGIPMWDVGFLEGNLRIKGIPWKEESDFDKKFPRDGLETLWHENGRKYCEVNYKDGKEEGLFTVWHENGQISQKGNYKNGKEEGLFTGWYENGQKKHEGNMKDGKLMSAVVWKPNGEKCPVTNVKDGNGVIVHYEEDGTESSRSTFKDGVDLDNPETLDEIIAEAIDFNKLQEQGKEGEELRYAPNEQTPYTGWTKIMAYKKIRGLLSYKDGKLDGLSTGWFVLNGQKKYEHNWKDGKKDGLSTGWFENGQKEYEQYNKDGKLEGLSTGWYENGQKKFEENFKDGKLDRLATKWYENGQKFREGNWKDGKEDGLFTGWYENGQKKFEHNWKDGKLMSAVIWKPNGEKCPVTNIEDGNGIEVWYNENGTEKSRSNHKDGKLDGLSTGWFENGQKKYEHNWKDGKEDGLSTGWFENGLKKYEHNWKDGKKDGLFTGWYENGQKEFEFNHKAGKLMSAVVWKPNGEKCPNTNLKDGTGVLVYYNVYGTKHSRKTYKNGEIVED